MVPRSGWKLSMKLLRVIPRRVKHLKCLAEHAKIRGIFSRSKKCFDVNEELLGGPRASSCPEGVCMFLSPRTCLTKSCNLDRRRGYIASGHMRSLPLWEKDYVPPSKGNREENFSHDPDSRRIEKEYALLKISQHMPAHVGLKFKVTLPSGLGNVHREVDLKGYQILRYLMLPGQPVLSGENKKRSTLSTGLENLEEINEIIPLRNNTFTCFSDHWRYIWSVMF